MKKQNPRRRKNQERSINIGKEQFHDYPLARDYSVSEMTRYLKKSYDIDFHNTEYRILKGKAVSYEDYLIDIACDIKELLTSDELDRYFYMDVLLTEFKKGMQKVA